MPLLNFAEEPSVLACLQRAKVRINEQNAKKKTFLFHFRAKVPSTAGQRYKKVSKEQKKNPTFSLALCIITLFPFSYPRSIQAMVSPWRICWPGLTVTSTSLPPRAAGISTISPHLVCR